MVDTNQKIVIVGAGMAGLTAAAYLSKENYDVLVVEKNDRWGGLVHTFDMDGFSFDSGPRAFINSGMVKPMLTDLGVEWDFLDNKISIGIEDQLFSVESMDSLTEYQQILGNLYPENLADIKNILSAMQELSHYTRILYEFDNPNFGDVLSDRKFIFKELIPWTFKFLKALRKMNKYDMPMEIFLEGLTDNQSLIDILTQMFFRKTPTHFAMGYFYVYLDYFYPRSGTGALPRLLYENLLSWGGKIRLNTRITEVRPSEKIIIDSDGNSFSYDRLIWSADLKTLYRNLNLQGMDENSISKIEEERKNTLSSKGAESVFIMFIGVDRPPSYFRAKGGEHLFYTPSKSGLGKTHLEIRQNLIDNFESMSKSEIEAWVEDYLNLNTFEVSIPALRDPSLAPEGQTGLSISCLFDYEIAKKINKAGWYQEFKEIVENRILNLFSQSIYEGFEDDILFKFSSTPLTIEKTSGSSEGAITGWSFETDIPVINTLKDIPKSVLTPIPGVLKAGQWAYAPAGVPIAMLTGWYATQNIIKGS